MAITATPAVQADLSSFTPKQQAAIQNMLSQLKRNDDSLAVPFNLLAPLASPAFTGHPTGVTEAGSDNSTRLASTAYVTAAVAAGGSGPSLIIKNITPVSRVNVTGVLCTDQLPAGKLATNGQEIHWAVAGTLTIGGGSTATIQIRFGTTPTSFATLALDGTTNNATAWGFTARIVRKSATEVYVLIQGGNNNANGVAVLAGNAVSTIDTINVIAFDAAGIGIPINLANAQTLDCNVSANSNTTVTQLMSMVEFWP